MLKCKFINSSSKEENNAVIDTGSTFSYISNSLAKTLDKKLLNIGNYSVELANGKKINISKALDLLFFLVANHLSWMKDFFGVEGLFFSECFSI